MAALGSLVALGGDSLAGFALALLLGLVIGTLSSVFTATPLLLVVSRAGNRGSRGRRRPGDVPVGRPREIDPYASVPSGR